MLENREQLRQECIQAAIVHYGLHPMARNYPVVRELPLERQERLDYTHKFAVLVAGLAALVYRDWQQAYKMVDDPGRVLTEVEQAEKEEYQVFMIAVGYLEMDVARIGRIEVAHVTPLPGAPYAAHWHFSLNLQECHVVRYDEPDGFRYSVLEPGEGREER